MEAYFKMEDDFSLLVLEVKCEKCGKEQTISMDSKDENKNKKYKCEYCGKEDRIYEFPEYTEGDINFMSSGAVYYQGEEGLKMINKLRAELKLRQEDKI